MALDSYRLNSAAPAAAQPSWHARTVSEVASDLSTDPTSGLSSEQAKTRLRQYGPNELRAAEQVSPWVMLIGQFKNVLIIIL